MPALHVHGQAIPTSRVKGHKRTLVSPLHKASITSRQRKGQSTQISIHEQRIPVLTDHILTKTFAFQGLDVLSAIDYLKRLQTHLPPRLSTTLRTELLNRRRAMPALVLEHQLASLLPNMRDLERELLHLTASRSIIKFQFEDGNCCVTMTAYLHRKDYLCPVGLLTFLQPGLSDSACSASPSEATIRATATGGLTDAQIRDFMKEGWLIERRRNSSGGGQGSWTLALSLPNIGTFMTALRSARNFITTLPRGSPLMVEKNVRARYEQWKDGGLFHFDNMMHDLVGSGRVEVLLLTTGRALRLTKRGRVEHLG